MGKVDNDVSKSKYLHSLCEYVLSPVETAIDHVDIELRAVEAEQAAFEQFAERVRELNVTVPPVTSPTMVAEGGGCSLRDVQSLYRECILNLDHFEDNKNTFEDIHEEFGPDIAHQVHTSNAGGMSPQFKRILVDSATSSAYQRQTLRARLQRERESLVKARSDVSELVGELSSVIIPRWYRGKFVERLNDIAACRQEELHRHGPLGRIDTEGFCEYLYGSEPWSYPALSSVARLRESVVVDKTSATEDCE